MIMVFCLSQLSTGSVLCRKLYNSWFSDLDDLPHVEGGPSLAGCILLSIASILVPSGYNQDRRLGHTHGRGWKLVVVSWLGGGVRLATVISHALSNPIPNTFTVLQDPNMHITIPKTLLDLYVHGKQLSVDQPEIKISIEV